MFSNLKIRHRMYALIGFVLLGFGLFGGSSLLTLNELKINGPVYQRIVQGKDLIADVLPPPHYIIESYLVALELEREKNASERDKLVTRMKALEKEYDERHEFWKGAGLDKRINELMSKDAHEHAKAFYAIAYNELVPALQRGDLAVERAALEKMSKHYALHRTAIDEVVQIAQKQSTKDEEEAKGTIKTAYTILIAIFVGVVGFCLIISGIISRSLTQPINEAVRIAETVASGDLTSQIEVTSADETGQLMQALKNMNDSLINIVNQVRTGTNTIATASAQIAAGNQDLSSRTEQQASSLEESASSMEELASTVRQNADSANQANQLAINASQVAVRGGEVVHQVVETMNEINNSSKKMSDIISVIDGIAFQTNILALNAAVEAARAGEQGRGFAVVATEVRNLAQRSAAAAREIKALIDDSVIKVEAGSKLVDQAGVTMNEVVDSIRRVNDIMGEITSASREQSEGIEQVNQAVMQMDQVTQQNAALVEEAAAAAESMQDQAAQLVEVVSVFRTGHAATSAPAKLIRATATAKPTTSLPAVKLVKPAQTASAPPARAPRSSGGAEDWEEF